MWLGVFATAQPLVARTEDLQAYGRDSVSAIHALGAGPVSRERGLSAAIFLIAGRIARRARAGKLAPTLGATIMGALSCDTGMFLPGSPEPRAAPVVAQPVQMGMMFLSGTLLPAAMLPAGVRAVVRAIPLTYVADALRQTVSAVPPMFPLWVDFAAMAGWIALFFALSVKLFRWE